MRVKASRYSYRLNGLLADVQLHGDYLGGYFICGDEDFQSLFVDETNCNEDPTGANMRSEGVGDEVKILLPFNSMKRSFAPSFFVSSLFFFK